MTRRNQKEKARAKNLKKQQEEEKKKAAKEQPEISYAARMQRDAEVMREKQQNYEKRIGAKNDETRKK